MHTQCERGPPVADITVSPSSDGGDGSDAADGADGGSSYFAMDSGSQQQQQRRLRSRVSESDAYRSLQSAPRLGTSPASSVASSSGVGGGGGAEDGYLPMDLNQGASVGAQQLQPAQGTCEDGCVRVRV